jgi:hypothetical protein
MIPRFSLSHDEFQSVDSPKYLTFSTREFELPPDRPVTFAADLAVENIGGEPGDFRRGMAAFHVFDLDLSKRVFAVCGTSTRVFALHEQLGLGGGGAGEPFYHVVESPYEDFRDDFTRLRACEITLERSSSTAAWRVDGHTVYQAPGTLIPERAGIAFGIWTMLPIREGRSRSLGPEPEMSTSPLRRSSTTVALALSRARGEAVPAARGAPLRQARPEPRLPPQRSAPEPASGAAGPWA